MIGNITVEDINTDQKCVKSEETFSDKSNGNKKKNITFSVENFQTVMNCMAKGIKHALEE